MNIAEYPTAPPALTWFKSSYSGAEGGECVEVAASTDVVHIRDSKTLAGPVIRITPQTWTRFIATASTHLHP